MKKDRINLRTEIREISNSDKTELNHRFSINRTINQSIDQSVNQPNNQSINQSIVQSVSQSVNQSINQIIIGENKRKK